MKQGWIYSIPSYSTKRHSLDPSLFFVSESLRLNRHKLVPSIPFQNAKLSEIKTRESAGLKQVARIVYDMPWCEVMGGEAGTDRGVVGYS